MQAVSITSANIDTPQLRLLYESAFPVEEQIPFTDIKRLMTIMPIDFTAYYNGLDFVGITIVLNRPDFNWGWYFAVKEDLRGRGYGQQILTMLKARYDGRPLIIDIESPRQPDSHNPEQRRRRYEFYKRNGFSDTPTGKSFDGIDYTILLLGEGCFTQTDYDNIISDLQKVWKR